MKTKIYHGSLNEITNFKGRIWCSSDIRFANEAILMQDNFEHDFSVNGDFGHIYFTPLGNVIYTYSFFASDSISFAIGKY